MILEAVYEPVFLNVSHGFRPKRSCHTALKSIKCEFNGVRWFVEGDIKSCFDNMEHELLIKALEEHVTCKWAMIYIKRWLSVYLLFLFQVAKIMFFYAFLPKFFP